MLTLSLRPEEYFTINGDIVVKVSRVTGTRCLLSIDADRSVPIVRGKVLERSGMGNGESGMDRAWPRCESAQYHKQS